MSEDAAPAITSNLVLARMAELLGTPLASEVDVLQLVRYGMTGRMWAFLNARTQLPPDLYVPQNEVRMTVALGRRFTPAQTDHILQAVRIVAQAWIVHGNLAAAVAWLAIERDVLPGYKPVSAWNLATSQTGVRVVEAMLGLGSLMPSEIPAGCREAVGADHLLAQANMSPADLAWADALEEQRAAGLLPLEASTPTGSDLDVDTVLTGVGDDRHDPDWAEAIAEQASAEMAASAAAAHGPDVDALLADVQGQASAWQRGVSVDQVVNAAEHEGLLDPKKAS